VIPLRDVIPSRTTPYVTVTSIALNVLAFLYELSLGDRLDRFLFAGSRDRLFNRQPFRRCERAVSVVLGQPRG
jgi:hypothetical protein